MDMHIPPLPTTNHVYNNLDKLVINDEDNNDDIDQDISKSTDTIDTAPRKKRPASILGLKSKNHQSIVLARRLIMPLLS
jgi:hypothetical protein